MSAPGPGPDSLAELRRLARRRSSRSTEGRFLVDGPVLLGEALEAGVEVVSVHVEPSGARSAPVLAAAARGVPVLPVPDGALRKVLDLVAPQPVVAVAVARPAALGDVVAGAVRQGAPLLVLVALQDPGNAGTLVRVAEAAGCAGVVLTAQSVDLYNPKTVRASAGSLFRVPVAQGAAAPDVLAACAAADLPVFATVPTGGVPPDAAPLDGAVALLLGNEAHGLDPALVAGCAGALTLPMAGRVESLNAAVAGAVLAFESARRRAAGRSGSEK